MQMFALIFAEDKERLLDYFESSPNSELELAYRNRKMILENLITFKTLRTCGDARLYEAACVEARKANARWIEECVGHSDTWVRTLADSGHWLNWRQRQG